MLHRIQMILRSPFGASCVKHNYMELMKQGDDFLRQVVDLTSILNLLWAEKRYL